MTKILFLGDGYPLGTEAGSVLYKKLIKSYGISDFCYYGLGSKTNLEWPEEFRNMPKKISSMRIWPKIRGAKYLKIIPIVEELYYFLLIPIIHRKIRIFAQKNNVSLIIAVFRADVLAIINKFDKQQKYPLLGFISDTVEAEYMDKPIIYRYKQKEYLKAINTAKGIYVAGEAMDNYFKNNFNKVTSILRLGFLSNFNGERDISNTNKEIRIFFSGSVYADQEIEMFIKALDVFAFIYKEYNVVFTTATNYTIKSKPNNITIVNLGWLDEVKLISIMQSAHLGYVPYKFESSSTTQMTYAFPNKTGFYLSTGLPIFFHGPVYSSMSSFFDKYPCGIHCSSMDINIVVANLEKILFDSDFYNKCLSAGEKAYNNEFSLSVMTENFKKLINNHI